VAYSLVTPAQAKVLDEIERSISRELEWDEVEGIPAPPRPVFRRERSNPKRRAPAPPRCGRAPARTNTSFVVRRRRDREAQGANRS
jgi:ATP-dependent RNA helicase DeaD